MVMYYTSLCISRYSLEIKFWKKLLVYFCTIKARDSLYGSREMSSSFLWCSNLGEAAQLPAALTDPVSSVYLSKIWDLHRTSPYQEQFRSDNERRSPDWQREQGAISAL